MHGSFDENIAKCYEKYVNGPYLNSRETVTVGHLAASKGAESYRRIFGSPKLKYMQVDLLPSPAVDGVSADPSRIPMPDASFDIVLSVHMLEHAEFFWVVFQEMVRVVKPDGLLFVVAAPPEAIHGDAVGCYRFYPDAYQALARYTACELVDTWQDDRGSSKSLVGVFRRNDAAVDTETARSSSISAKTSNPTPSTAVASVRKAALGDQSEPVGHSVAPKDAVPEWRCAVPAPLLSTIQAGVFGTKYKGRRLLKSPFDIVLYLQLLQRLRPRTIIEIGTAEAGSSLWFADTLSALGQECQIIAIDVKAPPQIDDRRITFLSGNARQLGDVLPPQLITSLPHPWLVVEDSAHWYEVTLAVLEFFDRHLRSGDYIVVEDGIVAFLPEEIYRKFEGGPNRAVENFLATRPGVYEIDRTLCDLYGFNVTYNPNGWLRRRRDHGVR